jgi:hypothetical protein
VSEREEVVRRWRLGEERLYPVVTVRPDLYETCIGLVRSLADHLDRVPDLDALVTSYRTAERDDDFTDAGVDLGELPPEIDLDLVRDAAYQVRARELEARGAAERTQRAIDRARARGEATVVIWSQGESELWPPHRRVEMSVATGRALSLTTELDPERMTPRFVLEALQLDPETGEATDDPPLAPRAEYADADARSEAAGRLRAALLTP